MQNSSELDCLGIETYNIYPYMYFGVFGGGIQGMKKWYWPWKQIVWMYLAKKTEATTK